MQLLQLQALSFIITYNLVDKKEPQTNNKKVKIKKL